VFEAGRGADTVNPIQQLGNGCLTDQLCGQYLAHLAGLGSLLDPSNVRKALESIHRYNYKSAVGEVQNDSRAFAVEDEPAVIICSYRGSHRPEDAFGYSDEAMTGMEYAVAAMMIFEGLIEYGLEAVENVRLRYDGEKRNPWNEPEAGYHYARAMSSWGVLVALSGFSYHAADASVIARPRINAGEFASFWSTGTGWGMYSQLSTTSQMNAKLSVLEGVLRCRTVEISGSRIHDTRVMYGGESVSHEVRRTSNGLRVLLNTEVSLRAGDTLSISL
jgi:hypothetical protein